MTAGARLVYRGSARLLLPVFALAVPITLFVVACAPAAPTTGGVAANTRAGEAALRPVSAPPGSETATSGPASRPSPLPNLTTTGSLLPFGTPRADVSPLATIPGTSAAAPPPAAIAQPTEALLSVAPSVAPSFAPATSGAVPPAPAAPTPIPAQSIAAQPPAPGGQPAQQVPSLPAVSGEQSVVTGPATQPVPQAHSPASGHSAPPMQSAATPAAAPNGSAVQPPSGQAIATAVTVPPGSAAPAPQAGTDRGDLPQPAATPAAGRPPATATRAATATRTPGPPEPGSSPAPDGSCPATHLIKGNISSRTEKIYHQPGGQFYNRTKPERCFASPAEAEAAGFRASQR